jgi:hypothetical protein
LDHFSLSHFNDNYILPNRNWAIFVISFKFWPNKINTIQNTFKITIHTQK